MSKMAELVFFEDQNSQAVDCEKKVKHASRSKHSGLVSTIPRPMQRHRNCYMKNIVPPLSKASLATSTQIPVLKTSSIIKENIPFNNLSRNPVNAQRNPYADVKAKVNTNRGTPRGASNFGKNTAGKPKLQLVQKNILDDGNKTLDEQKCHDADQPKTTDVSTPLSRSMSLIEGDGSNTRPKTVIKTEQTVPAVGSASVLQHYNKIQQSKMHLKKAEDEKLFRLQEELAILAEENKELDRKYCAVMDKYDQEKARTRQLEEQKAVVCKNLEKVEETIKMLQKMVMKWESILKVVKVKSKLFERRLKNKSFMVKIQKKRNTKQLRMSEENAKLEAEIAKCNKTNCSLETANKELREDLATTRAALDESIYNRNELRGKLAMNLQALNETKAELEIVKMNFENSKSQIIENQNAHTQNSGDSESNSKGGFNKIVKNQNIENQDLKAKLSNLEEMLREKLVTENMLMSQVTSLQRQLVDNDKSMRIKVKKMNCITKSLIQEKTELENIIAQKCLELGHRELLMQDQLENTRERERTFIFRRKKTFYTQGFYGKEPQNVMENMRTSKNYTEDTDVIERKLAAQKERVGDLYGLLESKQMEVSRLERRLLRLQKTHEEERQKEACKPPCACEVLTKCCSLAKAFLPNEYRKNYRDLILKKEDMMASKENSCTNT